MKVIVKNFFKSILYAFVLPVMPMTAMDPAPEVLRAEESVAEVEPIVILGGGVGSLTSALYMGRAGISPLVISGPLPGGLLTQSHSVQNWPGEMEIEGAQLTEKMREQAEANGARFLNEEVISVDFSEKPYIITTRPLDGTKKTSQIITESCIIAMGTKPNFLGIPGEQDYWGKGVTNCAVCDGSLYADKVVGVVGGGDAAVLEALYLSNIAKEVHVFVRKDSLRAIEEKRIAVLREKENVKFIYNTTVTEVKGDGEDVLAVMIKTGEKAPTLFPLDGLFLAIGSTPNSAIFKNQLKLDDRGYISLQKDQQTSVEGVYAIGDIVDPVYKQAISAAGDGAKASLQAQNYLSDRANKVVIKEKKPTKVVANEEVAEVMSEVIEVSSLEQFQNELETSQVPVVVDFYATWCGPCKRISPMIESSATQLAGKVKFLKVNVDNFFDLSTTYKIKAMPTILVFDASGEETERQVGLEQITTLLERLEAQN
jgi:thioredoxin reductase (NADPH)